MKRVPSSSPFAGGSEKRIGLSQSEVQALIKEEIHSAIKSNETKLQRLLERVQQLDCEVDFESSIHKLEARINMVSQKAEAALAFMTKTQKKTLLPSIDNTDGISEHSDNDPVDSISQNKKSVNHMEKDGELLPILDRVKEALKRMHADNKDLTDTIAGLSKDPPPPCLTPYGSPNYKEPASFIKEELKDEQDVEDGTEEVKQPEEPKAKRLKVEHIFPGTHETPKPPDPPQQETLSYPPLPSTAAPTSLKTEANSYSLPQRPEVHLALIKEPCGLSVLWKVKEEDPCAPPMDSYTVFMTTEKVKGSGVFPAWKVIGEVKAIALPMCVMVTKYKLGHKLCVSVIGKDTFGRYGAYSKVVSAAIPD